MNTGEQELVERLQRQGRLTLRLDIINKCNLQCVMCHYSDEGVRRLPLRRLRTEQFRQQFGLIIPHVGEVVLSCHDEPLMAEDFNDILAYLSGLKQDLDLSICTNATLLKPAIRRTLIEHGLTFLMFSIDGVMRETFERIRVGARFDQVIANIKAMAELKRASGSVYPAMALNFVMMRSNLNETVALLDIAADIGADLVDYRHVTPSEYWSDPDEMLENHRGAFNYYRRKLVERAARLGVKIVIPDAFDAGEEQPEDIPPPEALLGDYRSVAPDSSSGPTPRPKGFSSAFVSRAGREHLAPVAGDPVYCERPFSEITIRRQDEILPCPFHKTVLGRLSESESLLEVFLGERFAKLRRQMVAHRPPPGCAGCPIKQNLLPTRNSDEIIRQLREQVGQLQGNLARTRSELDQSLAELERLRPLTHIAEPLGVHLRALLESRSWKSVRPLLSLLLSPQDLGASPEALKQITEWVCEYEAWRERDDGTNSG